MNAAQQSQIIGIRILSGDCGGKIVYINVKKEGGQDRPLGDAVSETSKPASLALTGGETSMSNKLKDHPNHVLIRRKS